VEAEEQRQRAGIKVDWERGAVNLFAPAPAFAATFVRLRGGDYRVVLTVDQWMALWREAQ
jgi:hypothetical protein